MSLPSKRKEDSSAQRSIFSRTAKLNEMLQQVILRLLTNDRPVYLEGLGILYTITSTRKINQGLGEQTALRKETRRIIKFEKTYELLNFHKQKYNNITDTRELARNFCQELPAKTQASDYLDLISQQIKLFFNEMRSEILLRKVSRGLSQIGIFAGTKFNVETPDWREKFARSEIFLLTQRPELIDYKDEFIFDTPRLNSAWEPLEGNFGPAIHNFELNLAVESENLGYDLKNFTAQLQPERLTLKIAVFYGQINSKSVWIYSSDGLRYFTHDYHREQTATEICLQISGDSAEAPPRWPADLFVLAWMALISNPGKTLKAGTAFELEDSSLIPQSHNLRGLLLTKFRQITGACHSNTGSFTYLNLLGITESEILYANETSPHILMRILADKDMDQLTKTNRKILI